MRHPRSPAGFFRECVDPQQRPGRRGELCGSVIERIWLTGSDRPPRDGDQCNTCCHYEEDLAHDVHHRIYIIAEFRSAANKQRNQLILAMWCNNNSFSSCGTLSKSCLPIGDGDSEAVIGLRRLSRLLPDRRPDENRQLSLGHAYLQGSTIWGRGGENVIGCSGSANALSSNSPTASTVTASLTAIRTRGLIKI